MLSPSKSCTHKKAEASPNKLRKCASHNTLLIQEQELHLPLLRGLQNGQKPKGDVPDGLHEKLNYKKHKKSASSSSYVYEDKSKRFFPPWDVESYEVSSTTKHFDLFIKESLPVAAQTWDLDFLSTCNFDPNSPDVISALENACHRDHSDVIGLLFSPNDSLTFQQEERNFHAFCIAAYCDRGDVLTKVSDVWPSDVWRTKHYLLGLPFKGECVSILHLMAHTGCLNSVSALIDSENLKLSPNLSDSRNWAPLHYAASQGHIEIVQFLLERGADPNAEGPFRVCPLHVAVYKNSLEVIIILLEHGADPNKLVNIGHFSYFNDRSHSSDIPEVVDFNFRQYSTLLHWAVVHGNNSLIQKLFDKGALKSALDIEGRSPLGLALTDGQEETIMSLVKEDFVLSDADKNWRRLKDEESGNKVIEALLKTGLDSLECASRDGYSLLHLAASRGYLSMLITLLSNGVRPDVENFKGETPIFSSVENNHQACAHELIRRGSNIYHLNKKDSSILHFAARYNNFSAIDTILKLISSKEKNFINTTDDMGYTAIYYAISESRFDIVQRFVHFCTFESMHIKATEDETLLQFYTERNILGQYDNAIVRVLELEKELHEHKFIAEKCVRTQLGTTFASTKAREQLQAMYEPLQVQRHCWNFWIVITCFIMPSFLYYLDVYTDFILAVEYYNDYYKDYIECPNNSTNCTNSSNSTNSIDPIAPLIFNDLMESQSKVNLMLTVFFILFPMLLLTIWSYYVHLTQPNILPALRRMPSFQRAVVYLFILFPPIGLMISYIENTFAQVNYINVTTKSSKSMSLLSLDESEADCGSKNQEGKENFRFQYNLKHIAQMRVAINNVLEATLESAFQLVLQLYIVGTQYKTLKTLHLADLTIGSILSLTPTDDLNSRLSKQVLSVLISLVSLTWSFTSYHRFSKLGGLRILSSLPLLFAYFFQILSRAIACTVFTLAFTWRIFIVLGIHFMMVLLLKTFFEKRSKVPSSAFFSSSKVYSNLRPYFYVIMGAFTSTFVYFRIVRPQDDKDQLSERHPTFLVQSLFLALALAENTALIAIGTAGLNPDYDNTFKIVSIVLCLISFIIGVILQYVYYGCFGHPWVNINGPSIERDDEGYFVFKFFRPAGQVRYTLNSCNGCWKNAQTEVDNVYLPSENTYKLSNGISKC